ncbi:MAG: GNAT family N-acetyltransferase [Actinobacteria bacterium]|nr:GNAT family N-acetyltransferase [Actinomycetota bacterium]
MGTLSAELIDDLVQMEPVEDRWRDLAESRSNAFVTPDWFHSWWEFQGSRSSSPLISVVRREDGSIAGLMPLVLDRSSRPRAIRFAGASIGDRFHPIAEVEDEDEVAAATLAALEGAGLDGTMLLFEHASSESRWWRMQNGPPAKRKIVEQQQTVAPYIDLRGLDWDGYLAKRSRKFRKQVRRAERTLTREHGMRIRTTDAETLDSDLAVLFRLHDLRRNMLGGSSLGPPARRSLRRFALAAQRRDWLRLIVLEADGGPIAAFLGWRFGDSFVSYQGGFDPAWSKQSVGFALEALAIRAAIEEGAAEYDFLLGTEDWKRRFTDEERPSQTAIVLRAGRPVWALVAAEARLRALADRFERRPATRKLVRSMHGLIPTARRS